MIVSVDGGCDGVQERRRRHDRRHLAAVPAEDGGAWASTPASTYAKTGKKVSGYTDTGVTLIADKPMAGVDSKDAKIGTDLCWGKK